MLCGRIRDGDYLYRPLIFPLSFSRAETFIPSKLFHLAGDPESGAILGSLVWERFAPTPEYIHAYGCRLAEKMNKKQKTKGKDRQKDRRVYCGAYGLRARSVRSLAGAEGLGEVVSADVTHLVEDGEIAHAELRIMLDAGTVNVEGTKTAILDRLVNASVGPLRHVCECDSDLAEHPSENLSIGQSGEYVNRRSYVNRLWRIVRFHLCVWFLRASYR